jgi:diacylglycerol kinase (ATP)
LGTGNDFARGVGIPLGHREAARLIRTGQPRPVDLIVDDTDGVVVNAVHVGAGAEAALISRPWKRRLRTAAFPLGAISAVFLVEGWRLRVEVDVTVSLATGRLARVGYSLALLRGRHPERSDVIHASGTTVTISGSPFHLNADGELSGPVRRQWPWQWPVVPGGWRCVLPDSAP